jgi:hypothetical protein
MVQNSQTVGQHLKFLSLRKPFMLGKIGIKVLDKLNNFLKINLFPAVLGLLKYCFVQEKKSYIF